MGVPGWGLVLARMHGGIAQHKDWFNIASPGLQHMVDFHPATQEFEPTIQGVLDIVGDLNLDAEAEEPVALLDYLALLDDIRKHDRAYFIDADPLISDFEYDQLVNQAIALENQISKYPTIKVFRNGKPQR